MANLGGRENEDARMTRLKKHKKDEKDDKVDNGDEPLGVAPGAQAPAANAERPPAEGLLVCWLASSMPLDKKIQAASAAMATGQQQGLEHAAVSPRLACAVIHFAANALLRATPAASTSGTTPAPTAVSHQKDVRTQAFLNETLWSLIERSLGAPPDQVASTVSGIGGHLVRPAHGALVVVMGRCKVSIFEGEDDVTGDLDYVSLWRTML